jgi:drug/metabolite transporter (DMT)-like permease
VAEPTTQLSLIVGAGLGLAAALSWGFSNVFVAIVSRHLTSLQTLAGWQAGPLILIAILAALGSIHLPPNPSALLPAIGAGAIGLVAYVGLFLALALGPLAVVSPVIAANGGLTVILAVAILGESLDVGQAVGVGLAMVGVLLTGVRFERQWRQTRLVGPGVAAAVVALAAFSLANIASAVASRELGWQTALVASRGTGALLALSMLAVPAPRFLARTLPTSRNPDRRRLLLLIAIGSAFSITGFVFFMAGLQGSPAWLVGLTGSLSPVVVVAAGIFGLGERLTLLQWLGAGLILISLPLIAV